MKEFDKIKKGRWIGRWIYVDLLCKSKSGKTDIYRVMANTDYLLGGIKWYAPWRKYAFFPEVATLYEQDSLRDIAKFIEGKMKEYKKECRG